LNYRETINYLFTQLPMFQRKGPAAYKNSLQNTLELDKCYDHPHRRFRTVHVAGTNGKGSVSHMLASVLQSAGYKTGLYTSPHLKDFRERIRIDGKMISCDEVVDWVKHFRINNALWKIKPSFFELTVAMAFDCFATNKVDIAIIETGLGGRLDSTNIISPEISVITNIGLDHTNLLGNSLQRIAEEKAGIIKENTPVVVGTTQKEITSVFEEISKVRNAPLFFADQKYVVEYAMLGMDGNQIVSVKKKGNTVYPELNLDQKGNYQLKNLAAVLKSIDVLRQKEWQISEQDVYNGLKSVIKNTGLSGRWQVMGNNPQIICDTGHNEDGIKSIVKQLQNTAFKKLHFIFGTVSDKNPDKILALLPKNAKYYFVKADIERAMNAMELQDRALGFNLIGEAFGSVNEALESAKQRADKSDLIFIGGSTFVVAEIL